MSSPRGEFDPSNPEAFNQAIPNLVKTAIGKSGSEGRRAVKQLTNGMHASVVFDSFVIALDSLQQEALTSRTPSQVAKSMEVISNIFGLHNTASQAGDIRFAGNVLPVVKRVVSQDERLQNNRHLQRSVPTEYSQLINRLHLILPLIERGQRVITLEELRALEENNKVTEDFHNTRKEKWHSEFGALLGHVTGIFNPDALFTKLKEEPVKNSEEKAIKYKKAEISLEDIEAMIYPLSETDRKKITQFVTGMLSESSREHPNTFLVLMDLMESTVYFNHDGSLRDTFQNPNFMRNFYHWREHFWDDFVFSSDKATDNLFEAYTQFVWKTGSKGLFLRSFVEACDPTVTPFLQGIPPNHPIPERARVRFQQHTPPYIFEYFTHDEDYVEDFFMNTAYPQFMRRVSQFNPPTRIKEALEEIKEVTTRKSYGRIRAEEIAIMYRDLPIQNLLDHTERRAPEIHQTATSLWRHTLAQRDLHSLPLEEGVEVIRFSPGTPAWNIGIAAFYANREPSYRDWGINARFDLRFTLDDNAGPTPISIAGRLDPEGNLTLTTDLEDTIPGISAVLHYTSILALLDLTAKTETQRLFPYNPRQNTQIAAPPLEGNVIITNGGNVPRSRLVREQTDVDLIEDIMPRRVNPRTINPHPMTLPGHNRYLDAFTNYQAAASLLEEAEENSAPDIDTARMFVEESRMVLEHARNNMHQPRQGKLENWPDGIRHTIYIDPVTDRQVHGNTWVVEHKNPKLTEDEQLQVILFQRNYRHVRSTATALALLDEFNTYL